MCGTRFHRAKVEVVVVAMAGSSSRQRSVGRWMQGVEI